MTNRKFKTYLKNEASSTYLKNEAPRNVTEQSTRIDAEQEGDKIGQTTLTTIPIHYISSWSPSYEASQKLGLQLYENIDKNSIFLFLS